MTALAVAPQYGSDSRRVFVPGAIRFLINAGIPRAQVEEHLIRFDNRASQAQRYDEVCNALQESAR